MPRSPDIILFLLVSFVWSSCFEPTQNSDSYTGLQGFVQKGPFISGSTITIQELNNDLSPTGVIYTTQTNDDYGSFSISSNINSNFIEIIADGYYFNEVTAALSDSPLTLRALTDVSALKNVNLDEIAQFIEARTQDLISSQGLAAEEAQLQAEAEAAEIFDADVLEQREINVNILTTLAKGRIEYLVNSKWLPFDKARSQAQTEILGIFNIEDADVSNFEQMNIGEDGDSHAMLLAISAILQGFRETSGLAELISSFSADIEPDGSLDNTSSIELLNETNIELDLTSLRSNLEAFQMSENIPAFEEYLDSDADGFPNKDDDTCSSANRNGKFNNAAFRLVDGIEWIDTISDFTIYLSGSAELTLENESNNSVFIESSAIARFANSSNSTFYINSISFEITESENNRYYLYPDSQVTIENDTGSTFYIASGASLNITGELSDSDIYLESGADVEIAYASVLNVYNSEATIYSYSNLIEVGSGIWSTHTIDSFPSLPDFSSSYFNIDTMNLATTDAFCVHSNEDYVGDGAGLDKILIENGAVAELLGSTTSTLYVQSGGTLSLADGVSNTIYAQSDSFVSLSGSATEVTLYYESGATIDQSGIEDSAETSSENVVAVLFE